MNEQTTKLDTQINTLETIIENYIRVAGPLLWPGFQQGSMYYYDAYIALVFPNLDEHDRDCLGEMTEAKARVIQSIDGLKTSKDADERAALEQNIECYGGSYFFAKTQMLKRKISARMTPYQLAWLAQELLTIPLVKSWFQTRKAPSKRKKSAVTKA